MMKPSLLVREQWINNWFDAGVDKPLGKLIGDTEQRYWSFGSPMSFISFGIVTASALLQIVEILSHRKQELHNQYFMAVPAWIISSE